MSAKAGYNEPSSAGAIGNVPSPVYLKIGEEGQQVLQCDTYFLTLPQAIGF